MNILKEDVLPDTLNWQLEFARLVAFPTKPPLFLDQHWWQDIASEQSDEFVSTRKKDFREERGNFRGVVLSLRVDSSRVVWLIQPLVESEEPSGNYPTIGPFQEKVDWFVELLSPWLANSCPSLLRLAFTGKLLSSRHHSGGSVSGARRSPSRCEFESEPKRFILSGQQTQGFNCGAWLTAQPSFRLVQTQHCSPDTIRNPI